MHIFLKLFQSHRTEKKSAGRKRHYDLKMRQKLRFFGLPDQLMLTFYLVDFRSILVIDLYSEEKI